MRIATRVLATVVSASLLAVGAVSAPAQAADSIVIWVDPGHGQAIKELLPDGYKGTPIEIVEKEVDVLRADLAGVGRKQAPDVIWGDLAWTGELAGAGLLAPVTLKKKTRKLFRPNVLTGSVVQGEQFGLPVQISNLALITNTKLVPTQPRTFADLSALALKLTKKRKNVTVPFALAQGEGTSPWSTYPLFSGLGGYLFARSSDGSLNLSDIGLASKALRANAGQIDAWNASGLISSKLTAEEAKTAFANGRSPFWLAGPENLQDLLDLTFSYRIGALPPMKAGIKPVPLLTVQGFMITSYADKHGVLDKTSELVGTYFAREKAQQKLAAVSGLFPANTKAADDVTTGGGRVRAIGNAGANGVTMPNAPQAGVLWAPYAQAWTDSTKGKNATPAKKAFRAAQRTAKAALKSGDVPTG